VWIAAPPFIRIRVSPAKAAINSDWAIAEKLTGAWLPCQESSALQWPAQSNYRLKAKYRLDELQNPRSDPIRELGSQEAGSTSHVLWCRPFRLLLAQSGSSLRRTSSVAIGRSIRRLHPNGHSQNAHTCDTGQGEFHY
jgi:hypothetical protein